MSRETIHNIRISILSESLEAAKSEYCNLLKDFTDLDTKAQNTTAVAGIFLAGSLAFYNEDSLSKLIGFGALAVVLLGVAVSMLVMSVVFSIRTMKMRDIADVFSTSANEATQDLLAATLEEEQLCEGHERYIRSRISAWQAASSDLLAKNNEKAWTLARGQLCLNLAVVTVGLLFITALSANWILRSRKSETLLCPQRFSTASRRERTIQNVQTLQKMARFTVLHICKP